MRGQISAEMLIILAIVVAIALLVASQLITMAQDTSKQTNETHKKIMDNLENVTATIVFATVIT